MADLSQKKSKKLRGKKREMTQTEREFSLMLEVQKRDDKIQDWRFEGVRLLWGDCMVYKLDFSVLQRSGRIKLIEVKGEVCGDRDIVRFKGCRAEWKRWFDFELHQKANDTWSQIL